MLLNNKHRGVMMIRVCGRIFFDHERRRDYDTVGHLILNGMVIGGRMIIVMIIIRVILEAFGKGMIGRDRLSFDDWRWNIGIGI